MRSGKNLSRDELISRILGMTAKLQAAAGMSSDKSDHSAAGVSKGTAAGKPGVPAASSKGSGKRSGSGAVNWGDAFGSNSRGTLRERVRSLGFEIGKAIEPGMAALRSWKTALESAEHAAKSALMSKLVWLKDQVEVTEIDLAGAVRFRVFGGGQECTAIFAFNDQEERIAGSCSCEAVGLCEHIMLGVRYLQRQLMERGSFWETRIVGQTLEERRLKEQLERLSSCARRVAALVKPAATPMEVLQEEVPRAKYLWNLSFDAGSRRLSLRPVYVTEKKNGGWTKGRELSLESFISSSRNDWTKLEYSIAALFQGPFDYLAALRLLKGTDYLLLEREPAEFVEKQLELHVEDEGGGLRLTLSALRERALDGGDGKLTSQMVMIEGGVLVLSEVHGRVTAYRASEHASQLVRELTPAPFFPGECRDDVMDSLRRLSDVLPVHFPASMFGATEVESVTPGLLLCFRRNAGLDMTVVVVDSRGEKHFPGRGVMLRQEEEEGGVRRQVMRDSEAEILACEQVEELLGLKGAVCRGEWLYRVSDPQEADRILSEASRLVSEGRLKVLWHPDSVSQMQVIGRLTASNVRVSVSRQRDWFGLQGGCVIGDTEIPLKELLGSLGSRRAGGLVEVSPGKWASMTEELRGALIRLRDVSHESRGKLQLDVSAAPAMRVLEQAQVCTEADKHWKACFKRMMELREISPEPPAGLNAVLRDYQLEGFRWLSRLAHWGIGGILADDMGLGKTVQTLALLLTRVETGPALVIAPTSLGFNWQRECERFTPSMRPVLFRETDRVDLKNQVGDGDIVICSYGLALREAELLKEIEWGTLVLDEAQNVKNSSSKTAAAVRGLSAKWKLALTGTPMENHLGELWSIFYTIAPGVLGTWEQFRRRFAGPIEKERDPERREGLSRVISPFVLRRSKAEVLRDLPARTETNLMVDLSVEERERYDRMRLSTVKELDSLGDQLTQDQRFRVLQMLTRLRQLACHVGLVDNSWSGSSSKLDVLMERMQQLKERGSRPLVFSQFTSHLALIAKACEDAGISFQYLDGQTTPNQRQERVEAFQRGEGDAFLISLKAGGTGLNLTAADYVIHMDPWWNPAVEDQATDRTHRIGQTKPVMVYRIIARGTIEEQILSLHDQKRDLVDGVLAGADAAARLSTKELAELIRLGPEAVMAASRG